MPRLDPSYDAIVVGSGPNGLGAAVTLAQAGLGVLVCEARDSVGGSARSDEGTLPGLIHDVCSAIHPTGAASPLFRSLPLERHGLEWVHPELPLAHPLEGGRAAVLERSLDATARGLGEDERAYRRLLKPLQSAGLPLLDQLLSPPLGVPYLPLAMARFGLSALRSARSRSRTFAGEPARALLAGNAAHSVLPLEDRGSAAVGVVLTLAAHLVGWPLARGGTQRLSDALAAHLESLGGTIATGTEIRDLADLPQSRVVLFDVSPRQLVTIAGGALPDGYGARLQRFRHGPGVFKVDWALDGPVPWTAEACRRAGTVHVGGTFDEVAEAERAPWRGEVAERPFVLLAQQSLFDETRVSGGRQTLWGYCHVPSGSTVDMTSRIEAQVERFAPGFRERILERRTLNSEELEAYNPNLIGGDITGGANDLRQLLARPVPSVTPWATPNPRLYLCSSSTPPGGGVHGMCGYHAARAALSRAFGRS
ncbi:MAG: NAD(P)/FAD-dependent oxidoreductase [bacterium]|nr:NAD(P)/FAD-dependent oxidoreductase [bacterium]